MNQKQAIETVEILCEECLTYFETEVLDNDGEQQYPAMCDKCVLEMVRED